MSWAAIQGDFAMSGAVGSFSALHHSFFSFLHQELAPTDSYHERQGHGRTRHTVAGTMFVFAGSPLLFTRS